MAYQSTNFRTPTRVLTYVSTTDNVATITTAGYFPVNYIGSVMFIIGTNGQRAGIIVASGTNSTKLDTV
jgi:hypothetical protein